MSAEQDRRCPAVGLLADIQAFRAIDQPGSVGARVKSTSALQMVPVRRPFRDYSDGLLAARNGARYPL